MMRCIIFAVIAIVIFERSAAQSQQNNNGKTQRLARQSVQVFVNGKRLAPIKLNRNSGNIKVARRSQIIKCCGLRTCRGGQASNRNGTDRTKTKKIDYSGPSIMPIRIGETIYKFPDEQATFSEAKKICNKENMDIASLNNPNEFSKISEYLQYIGLSENPVFASLSSLQSSPLSNWGQDAPPGGEGSCLVQQNGALYNASCDQKAYFACEERPLKDGFTTTIGPISLSSIQDAVLSFVGGKNILVPSEKATVPEAKSLCAKQGLELMSLDSMVQMDSVQDFLGDMGLSTSTVLTSMSKVTGGGTDWLGDLASAFLPQKDPAKDGDCMGLNSLGLTGISCDTVSNFVCQAPDSDGPKTPPLSDLFSAFMPVTKAQPVELEGQEYILPSEKATYEEAKKLCESRQMDLLSIQTKSENDLISNFLNSKGVGSSPILTSLLSVSAGSFSWDGSSIADGLKWASNQPGTGDCATLSSSTLKTVSCEAKSNFMCEAKPADSSATPAVPGTTNLPTTIAKTTAAQPKTESPSSTSGTSSASSASTQSTSTSSTSSASTSTSESTTSSTSTTTSIPPTTTATSTSITTVQPAQHTYTVGKRVTYLFNETATYDEAAAKCEAMGMKFLIAECKLEYQLLMDELNASPERKNASYLIAIKKVSGTWTNPSGTFHTPPKVVFNSTLGGDCVVAQNGSWFTTPCDQKNCFACENKMNYTEIVYSSSGRYFVLRNLEVCLTEAIVNCKGVKTNASVVAIDSPYEHSSGEINTLLATLNLQNTSVFINNDNLNGTNWIINFNNLLEWATDNPNMTRGSCVGVLLGKLISVDCGMPLPFVCEVPNQGLKAFTYQMGSRATYLSDEMATYGEATAKCGEMGMSLLIAECSSEYRKLLSELDASPDRSNASYLIALIMVNGTLQNPSGNLHPAPGTPIATSVSGGDCVVTQNGSWFYTPCNQKHYFACEQKPNYTDVVFSTSSQYYVIRNLEGNCQAEAHEHCKKAMPNASMAMINYPFEHTGELNPLLKKLKINYTPVLVNRFNLNASTWFQTNSHLVEWNSGHPNMSFGTCIGNYLGKLISVDCAGTLPFVCEVPKPPIADETMMCLAVGKTCAISAYTISFHYASRWCQSKNNNFTALGVGDFDATLLQLRTPAVQAKLGYPGALAISAMKVSGVWQWSSGEPVNFSLLNWSAMPTTLGDCAGIDANYTYAVTFDCAANRRVLCL
ncbi:uncharacterized protein LOC132197297 [Neocloeon triangulifer]|uniref:uncharacterized protein LOC132197297 n=1 Tax=Neocloeon triangulifer TaxID=2078957 RepID=UPI00286F7C4A|nr:uncharacterized protein LOC132197297 [Neocloeon triangulifer]